MLTLERSFDGITCGIDEAGRAPLAGPVTAACVYIPPAGYRKRFWKKVTDSKQLTAEQRQELFPKIQANSCYGIAHATVGEIDRLNIHHATLLAMRRSFFQMYEKFGVEAGRALIDGKFCPADMPCETMAVIGGDASSLSIAAASVLAKVSRDTLMQDLAKEFPAYGWITNVGYPTPQHKAAIVEHGITIHHRRSFSPVREQTLASESARK